MPRTRSKSRTRSSKSHTRSSRTRQSISGKFTFPANQTDIILMLEKISGYTPISNTTDLMGGYVLLL